MVSITSLNILLGTLQRSLGFQKKGRKSAKREGYMGVFRSREEKNMGCLARPSTKSAYRLEK